MTLEDEFTGWFLKAGGSLHPNVKIAFGSAGFGLRTLDGSGLPSQSCVVSCPHTLAISWFHVIQGPGSFFRRFGSQDHFSHVNEAVIIRFFLVKQYLLKERSSWWPYIRCLPQPTVENHFNTPLWYEADDLVWIRGTNLEYALEVKKKKWREEYDEGMSLLDWKHDDQPELWSWFVRAINEANKIC